MNGYSLEFAIRAYTCAMSAAMYTTFLSKMSPSQKYKQLDVHAAKR